MVLKIVTLWLHILFNPFNSATSTQPSPAKGIQTQLNLLSPHWSTMRLAKEYSGWLTESANGTRKTAGRPGGEPLFSARGHWQAAMFLTPA